MSVIAIVAKPEFDQDVIGFVDRLAMHRDVAPEPAGNAAPFADRERHRFQRVEAANTSVDLESAGEPAAHAILRLERGDVLVAEKIWRH